MTEKLHIQKALKAGVRTEDRGIQDYREISLETGVIKNAEGSARVKIGDTEVLVGVKMSVETPYPDTPENGNLMVGTELLPMSNPNYESGPPSVEAIEISRVVDRGIRESGAIDTKKLVIKKGEKVWGVIIDIVTINMDGNLFDAAGLGAIAAIKDTKFPGYSEKDGIDYKNITKNKLPVSETPIPVTVYKAGDELMIDPNASEEAAIDARLTVAVMENGKICAMQKGGETPLSLEDIDKMMSLAIEKSKELRKHLK